MSENHLYQLSIPLNIDDVNNIPEGVLFEDIRFEEYQFTKEEFESLYPLFCEFDEALGILIDEYEDEIIPVERIGMAIELTRAFEGKDAIACSSACKFASILCRAQDLKKQLILSF